MTKTTPKPLSYKDAGVDIEAGDDLVERIKPLARSTHRAECIGGLGGFGGLFELAKGKYRNPVLVSGTDGVGTKLKLAVETGRHDSVGIDLVAMCVNDIIVSGAEPLFFLDYFATGQLDITQGEAIISGIAEGCRQAGAALLGGETAEMPGMYMHGDYDLAGFAVGIVEKSAIIDSSSIQAGDILIGMASSGPHSNGFSLIRKILQKTGTPLDEKFSGLPLADALLAPTRIYVKTILRLIEQSRIHGLAHITGGGLPGNLVRILGEHQCATIDASSWDRPQIFDWLQQGGNIQEDEMLRTFNCGIGMVAVVPQNQVESVLATMAACGERAWCIGRIEHGPRDVVIS